MNPNGYPSSTHTQPEAGRVTVDASYRPIVVEFVTGSSINRFVYRIGEAIYAGNELDAELGFFAPYSYSGDANGDYTIFYRPPAPDDDCLIPSDLDGVCTAFSAYGGALVTPDNPPGNYPHAGTDDHPAPDPLPYEWSEPAWVDSLRV